MSDKLIPVTEMAGVIKRQILKHLSRFTKNLSPEQIHLSTLRGEGQLTDLQLDEQVLQNMLDLPTWLVVTRVYCNQAAIRIQWTKLKTHPICLMIDKVEVEMKTCQEPRPPNGPSPIALATGQSEYGFAEKVVEGMFLDVGCISIKIESCTFQASVQLWQLQSYSVSPNWQKSDLRFTRLTHPQRGEVLTFKQVTWQTLRIEAYASETCEDTPRTPLRLLTNSGHLRIALKRRIKDCLVISSELSFFLDDLLWVLTDSQLEAFFSYANSLNEAIQKSVQQRKVVPSSPTNASICSDRFPPSTSSGLCEFFERFDVKETSYHLLISRLDLHLCNERQTLGTMLGDAIKLTLQRIELDYYPSHRTGQSCTHWHHASSAMRTCEQWIQDLSKERNNEEHVFPSFEKSACLEQEKSIKNLPSTSLYMRSMLVRVDKIDIHQVSTPGQTQQKPPLLSCVHIPAACSAVHLQYTEFYYLSGKSLTVPSPALYIQIHGLVISLTTPTILWLNHFMLDLSHHLQTFGTVGFIGRAGGIENKVVRLDGFNIKLILPVQPPPCSPPERPSSISAYVSRVTLTNTRQAPGSTIDCLQQAFRLFAANPVFHCPPGPLHPVFISHAYPSSCLSPNSLWSLHSSGLSVSFEGLGVKHQEFLHPISFTAWACLLQPEQHLQVILNIDDSVRVQLNHYQYLTLLRSQEQLQSLLENLQNLRPLSSHNVVTSPSPFPTLICVGVLIPAVSLSLLLPVTASLGTFSHQENSEKSSLSGLDLTDGVGSDEELIRASSTTDEKTHTTLHGLLASQKSLDDTVQQRQDCPQKMVQLKDLAEDPCGKKEVIKDAVQKKELTLGGLLGTDYAHDSLLSALGLTQEKITLRKERMQHFFEDKRDHDAVRCPPNVPFSQPQSPQSLDAVSIEGFDAMSLDSEANDGLRMLLDTEKVFYSGESESREETAEDASQITEGPEPQLILLVELHSVTCVSHLRGDDVSITLEASDVDCGSTPKIKEGTMETTHSSSSSPPCLTLKFDLGPSAAHRNGFLRLQIQDFRSELPVSSLTHLGPFLEDEQLPEILPMTIQITRCSIILKDDGPQLYFSPLLPQPITLTIQDLQVQRKEDGIFYIAGDCEHVGTVLIKESMNCQTKEELQKELSRMEAKFEQQREREKQLLQEIWKHNPSFHL